MIVRTRRAAAAAALFVFAACAPEAEVSEGQALYEAHCSACHGVDALGNGPLASTLPVEPARLTEHLGHHTRAQLIQLIQGGVPPAMPPSALDAEQVQTIVDHVWTLVPADEVAALRAMQEEVERTGMGAMTGMGGTTGTAGAGAAATPPAGAEEFAFTGTVRSVDAAARTLAVENEDIPGWMAPMTMTYGVDSPAVLDSLAAGDRITARVYAGDFRTLYGVAVAPR